MHSYYSARILAMLRMPVIAVMTLLWLTAYPVCAQIGYTHYSLEAMVVDADAVVLGSVTKLQAHGETDHRHWLDITFAVSETLKGPEMEEVTFSIQTLIGDERWQQFIDSGQQQLWFLHRAKPLIQGESKKEQEVFGGNSWKPARRGVHIRMGDEVAAEAGYSRRPPPIFTMNFDLLTERDSLLKAARRAVAEEPAKRPAFIALDIPRSLAQRTGRSGDANSFLVPADARLEAVAQRLIDLPEDVLPPADAENAERQASEKVWREFSENRLREAGILAMRKFKNPANIERLKNLLDHPATVETHGSDVREFYLRRAAWEMLREWQVEVEKPILLETEKVTDK